MLNCGSLLESVILQYALCLYSSNPYDMDKDDKEDDKDDDNDSSTATPVPGSPAVSISTNKSDEDKEDGDVKKLLPYPTSSDINSRLRRVVTCYQRTNRKVEMRNEVSSTDFLQIETLIMELI